MPKWISVFRSLWKAERPSRKISIPFSIPCPCGKTVTGERKETYQAVPCPDCRTELFVLPISPLPEVGSIIAAAVPDAAVSDSSTAAKSRRIVIASVSVLSLIVAAVVLFLLWQSFFHQNNNQTQKLSTAEIGKQIKIRQNQADIAITKGHFYSALAHLDALIELHDLRQTSKKKRQQLRYLRKEIALYADVLEYPLETLIEHALNLPKEEWDRVFAKRYQNKAVLLDTRIQIDGKDKITSDLFLQIDGDSARLDLGGLTVLRRLEFDQPKRVLFGARLKNIKQTRPREWTVQFVQGSAVLLTDERAAGISCAAWREADALAILERQRRASNKIPRP